MQKKLENGTSDDRLSNIFSVSKTEQSGRGQRYADTAGYFFRRDRKSVRPRFLSGR